MNASGIALGCALTAALALHAWAMGPQNLPHMLWSCHAASAVLSAGLLLNRRLLVATGFLFHLAIGLPAWLVEIIATRGTFGAPEITPQVLATSTLVHVLPLVSGAFYLRRSPLPVASLVLAWLLQVGMVPLSRWLTPPELNVNLAHAVWPPLASAFSSLLIFQLAGAVVTLMAVVLVWMLWNNFVAVRGHTVSESLPHQG